MSKVASNVTSMIGTMVMATLLLTVLGIYGCVEYMNYQIDQERAPRVEAQVEDPAPTLVKSPQDKTQWGADPFSEREAEASAD